MACVTPSLLKSDSNIHPLLPFFSANPITTVKLLLLHNSPTPEKLSLVSSLAFTPYHPIHTESRCTHNTLEVRHILYTHRLATTHFLSFAYTNTLGEGEEVNITLLPRMQKKFMLPLERESGILCELRWAIILFSKWTKKRIFFSGNMTPINISSSSHRSTATFALTGQMLICHSVGMCYFYHDYFYLQLIQSSQVVTFCLNT